MIIGIIIYDNSIILFLTSCIFGFSLHKSMYKKDKRQLCKQCVSIFFLQFIILQQQSSVHVCNYFKYLRKFSEHSVATALASNVFPVPGGPYNNTPAWRYQASNEHSNECSWWYHFIHLWKRKKQASGMFPKDLGRGGGGVLCDIPPNG